MLTIKKPLHRNFVNYTNIIFIYKTLIIRILI